MFIQIGPRMVGRCHFSLKNCSARNFNIVTKVLSAREGIVLSCQTCLNKKMIEDSLEFERKRSDFLRVSNS